MALAYRAYFAFIHNPLRNSKGENTSAVYGFTSAVLKIIRDEHPEYIACVFDTPEPTFRHKRYKEYKATREKMPEDMSAQLGDLKDICLAMGVPLIELPGYEADDVIGTIAKAASRVHLQAFIVSGDKDFMQLIGPGIRLFNPGKRDTQDEIIDEEGVFRRFGVKPSQVTDILGLMGDQSDNIPGVTGIGEKTAVKLITEFHSIEELYQNIDRLKGKQKENLLKDRENAFLSKELATIDTSSPCPVIWNNLKYGKPDREKLIALFTKMDFTSLIEKLGDGITPLPSRDAESIATFPHRYTTVRTLDDLDELINRINSENLISVDTETTDIQPMNAELVGISVSLQNGEAFYIPFNDRLSTEEIIPRICPVLENTDILKIGQNCKYDALVLLNHGIRLNGISFDSMIAAFMLNPDRPQNLDQLSLDFLNYRKISTRQIIGDKKTAISMKDAPVEQVAEYASEDADCVMRLYPLMKKSLQEHSMEKLFSGIEIPLIPVLTEMEHTGVRMDTEFLNRLSGEYEIRMSELERKIMDESGVTFNINSPQQMGEMLFERMQIQKHLGQVRVKRTGKTGQFSTDVKNLEKYRGLPVIDHILAYRQLSKLKSTYIDGLPPLVKPKTGRIHSTFSQTITSTGRLSSSNPNFQNIPVRTELGREIRKAFTPGLDGWHVVTADYSQIELRVLAHMSEDSNMHSAFEQGEDFHRTTAAKIFNVPSSEVTADQRRRAKDINFGIVYGMSAFGLAERIHITNAEAAAFIDQYFRTFPGVRNFIDRTISESREKGYVTTLFGRRRCLPDLNSKNRNVRQFAERVAVNTPIQGTAAEIIKLAMIRIHQELSTKNMKSRMILQVHDELVFEAPYEETETLFRIIQEHMENAVILNVPLKADIRSGVNWHDAK